MQVSEAYTVELWIDDIKNIRKVDITCIVTQKGELKHGEKPKSINFLSFRHSI